MTRHPAHQVHSSGSAGEQPPGQPYPITQCGGRLFQRHYNAQQVAVEETPRTIHGAVNAPMPKELTQYIQEQQAINEAYYQRIREETQAQLLYARTTELEDARRETLTLRQETEAYVQNLQQQAEALFADAQAQADGIRQQAYEEGYQQGYQDGMQQGYHTAETEVLPLMEAVHQLAERSHQAEMTVLKAFKKDAARIIETVLDRVLGGALGTMPFETLLALVEAATDELDMTGTVSLMISQDTWRQIEERTPNLNQVLSQYHRFSWEVDPKLRPNTILIRCRESWMDISPYEQIKQYLKPLTPMLPVEPPAGLPDDGTYRGQRQAGAPSSTLDWDPGPPTIPEYAPTQTVSSTEDAEAVLSEDMSQDLVNGMSEAMPETIADTLAGAPVQDFTGLDAGFVNDSQVVNTAYGEYGEYDEHAASAAFLDVPEYMPSQQLASPEEHSLQPSYNEEPLHQQDFPTEGDLTHLPSERPAEALPLHLPEELL